MKNIYFINEALKPKSKVSIVGLKKVSYFIPIYQNFTEYCMEIMGVNAPVKLKFTKSKKNSNVMGFVSFDDISKGKYIIHMKSDGYIPYVMGVIAHEMTHIRQFQNKELKIDSSLNGDMEYNKFKISTKKYAEIVNNYDIDAYTKLPWEIEAYANQSKLPKDYKHSDHFKKLIESASNPTEKFIYENIY